MCWNLLSADLRETAPNGLFQILVPKADDDGDQIDLAALGRLGCECDGAAGAGEGGQIAFVLHSALDVADEAAERVNIPAQGLDAGRNLRNDCVLLTGHAEVCRRGGRAFHAREAESRGRAFLAGAARLVMMMLMLMAGAVLIVAMLVVMVFVVMMLVLVAGAVFIVAVLVVMVSVVVMLMLVAGAVLIVAMLVVMVFVVMMLVLVAAAVLVVAMLMLVHFLSLL